MTLSYLDSMLVSERHTLLTQVENDTLVAAWNALKDAGTEHGVPLAMDDRAAVLEAAMIRYVMQSRPLAAPAIQDDEAAVDRIIAAETKDDGSPLNPGFKPTRSYLYLQDPSHGWLEVPLADVQALGIQKSISRYSYLSQDGKLGRFKGQPTAYLEEDCDMPKFMKAAQEAGWSVHLDERSCFGDAFCRGLPRFQAAT